jgi:aminoglycoside phosphotransferase (APT) family kinase protein
MDDDAAQRPTERDAALAVRAGLGAESLAIERFPTGICHYVYDVVTADGRRVVARLASADTRHLLAGGIYWHERLRDVGAPLPALLHADLSPASGFPYMLLERLPGQDLGLVYDELTREQRHALAAEIVALQRAVATLPHASGYGFACSYDDAGLRASWLDVVLADLERSHARIAALGAVPLEHVERVRKRVMAIAGYLRTVEPVAFLDDTTTKNVLVHAGKLSGVVDTDQVCFGDPLFTLALIRVALLAHDMDVDYADQWRDLLALSSERERALAVYVAVFAVGFMSEVGQRFNRDEPPPIGHAYLRRLEAILDDTLARC